MLSPPETNKRFLHDVLRVRPRLHPLAGEKEKAGAELRKTNFPIFMGDGILHDLCTVF